MEEKKRSAPESILNSPECINCFERITNHANGVFGNFEIQSNELFQDFNNKAIKAMSEIVKKTDHAAQEHFKKREQKEDEAMEVHFLKQAEKYDDFEKKVLDLIWKVMTFISAVIVVCSGIVAATWIAVQDKADKEKVLLLDDAKKLEKIRASYLNDKYLINPDAKINESNYMWLVESLFENNTRAGKEENK